MHVSCFRHTQIGASQRHKLIFHTNSGRLQTDGDYRRRRQKEYCMGISSFEKNVDMIKLTPAVCTHTVCSETMIRLSTIFKIEMFSKWKLLTLFDKVAQQKCAHSQIIGVFRKHFSSPFRVRTYSAMHRCKHGRSFNRSVVSWLSLQIQLFMLTAVNVVLWLNRCRRKHRVANTSCVPMCVYSDAGNLVRQRRTWTPLFVCSHKNARCEMTGSD